MQDTFVESSQLLIAPGLLPTLSPDQVAYSLKLYEQLPHLSQSFVMDWSDFQQQ